MSLMLVLNKLRIRAFRRFCVFVCLKVSGGFVRVISWFQSTCAGNLEPRTHTKSHEQRKNTKEESFKSLRRYTKCTDKKTRARKLNQLKQKQTANLLQFRRRQSEKT